MANYDAENISLEGTINLANTTLRSLFLLNGAASISVLTFAGNNQLSAAAKISAVCGIKWFGVGLVACVFAMVFAYGSQQLVTFRIGEENAGNKKKAAKMYRFERLAIGATLVVFFCSLGAFVFGALQVAGALLK